MRAIRSFDTAALVLGTLGTAAAYPFVADRIPVHWDASGTADVWMGKSMGLLLLPLVALVTYSMLGLLTRKDEPGRRGLVVLRSTVLWILLVAQLSVIGAGLGLDIPMRLVGAGALAAGMIAVGVVLPSLPLNGMVGVRTPWALRNETVWSKTQRLGRVTMFAGAALLFAMTALGVPAGPSLVVALCLAALPPSVYSYFAARSLDRA